MQLFHEPCFCAFSSSSWSSSSLSSLSLTILYLFFHSLFINCSLPLYISMLLFTSNKRSFCLFCSLEILLWRRKKNIHNWTTRTARMDDQMTIVKCKNVKMANTSIVSRQNNDTVIQSHYRQQSIANNFEENKWENMCMERTTPSNSNCALTKMANQSNVMKYTHELTNHHANIASHYSLLCDRQMPVILFRIFQLIHVSTRFFFFAQFTHNISCQRRYITNKFSKKICTRIGELEM